MPHAQAVIGYCNSCLTHEWLPATSKAAMWPLMGDIGSEAAVEHVTLQPVNACWLEQSCTIRLVWQQLLLNA